MGNSQITVRVPELVKELWKAMADREGRSLSNYLERLLLREQERIEKGAVTLDTLNIKLDNLLDCFSENKKRGTKNSEGKEKKLTAYDAWQPIGVCAKENWERWVQHLHACGLHLNHYMAEKHFEKLIEINNDGWDCDDVIEYVITAGHRKFYVPSEWVKK